MPPRSRVTFPPLDLAATRAAVAAGRSVRVGIVPMGQFPAGTAGRIRAVGDPEVDGAEFIQVEVLVGGARDVIPFAPADLSPIKRTQSAPEAVKPARAPRAAGRAAGPAAKPMRVSRPSPAAASATAALPAPGAPATPTQQPTPAEQPGPAEPSNPPAPPAPPSLPAQPTPPAQPDRAAATRRGPRPRRPALTITIATTGADNNEWQLEVRQGTRSLIKAVPIHPARAWELVGTLGHPELNTVVAQALSEQRRQAQERADRLARELDVARADLATFPLF